MVRDKDKDGNLNTNLGSLLLQIKDEPNIFYNKKHNLRHPYSYYVNGEIRFINSYMDLMDLLDSQKHFKSISEIDVFNKTKEVITSFVSFIDDVYTIFKCFCPPSTSKYKGKYNDKWLEGAESALISAFKKDINFTQIFVKINNEIKHNQGRICKLNFKSTFDGNCIGFFIQKYDAVTDSIVPFEEIHPKFNGMHTAFSFNWFLIEILGQFYHLNYIASKTLIELIYKMSSQNIVLQKIVMEKNEIINVINLLNKTLSNILFEDEYNKQFYQIELNDSKLLIKSPADKTFMKRFKRYKNAKIEFALTIDVYTLSYGLPYFKHSK